MPEPAQIEAGENAASLKCPGRRKCSGRLKCPGRADRQRVRIAELGADALVLGSKRHTPDFGLQTHTVGELVIRLFVTGVVPWTTLIHGTRLPNEGSDVS